MAESSLWEDMPDIAAQRDNLIKAFFKNNPISRSNAGKSQKHLQDIMDIDAKISSLTSGAQKALGGEISKIRKATNASQAYNDCP